MNSGGQKIFEATTTGKVLSLEGGGWTAKNIVDNIMGLIYGPQDDKGWDEPKAPLAVREWLQSRPRKKL